MYRLFIDDGADAALKPEIFLQPAFGEFGRCIAALPGLVGARDAAVPARPVPSRRAGVVLDARAGDPHRRVRQPRDRRLPVAPVRRARPHQRLPQALSASCSSSPPTSTPARRSTFGPRRTRTCRSRARSRRRARCRDCSRRWRSTAQHYVDGALNKTLHASVALDEGVQLLLCVNPLVPFDASAAQRRGRAASTSSTRAACRSCSARRSARSSTRACASAWSATARQYPDADIVLFEPDREDADMFFANIFSYWQRKRLCAIAFAKTRQSLARARRRACAAAAQARHRDPSRPPRRRRARASPTRSPTRARCARIPRSAP